MMGGNMKKSTVIIIVLLSILLFFAGYYFLSIGKNTVSSAPPTSVNIEGGEGGTQEIEANQQSGGANVEGDVDTVIVEDNALVNSTCSHPAQKNFGLLERNGYNGPMCKKRLALKIKRKNCSKKGGFIEGPVCVMEWEGTQWRVRVIK